MLRKPVIALLVVLSCTSPAIAGKLKGTTSLKDFQPVGTAGDKNSKHQQFDFTFVVTASEYICRTPEDAKVKATEFPVGSNVNYEIDNDKVKLKNSSGKEAKCTVMRVEQLPAASPR